MQSRHTAARGDGATARKLFDAFLAFDADDSASVAWFIRARGTSAAGADLKAVATGDPTRRRGDRRPRDDCADGASACG